MQNKKTLDATFATIVGVCAFASNVIIGAICEVSGIPTTHLKCHNAHMILLLPEWCGNTSKVKEYSPAKHI